MSELTPKDPGERIKLRFDFSPDLDPGVNLQSSSLKISAVRIGNTSDPGITFALVSAANGVAIFLVTGGRLGSKYRIRCESDTDASPPEHLIITIDLPIQYRMGIPA